MTSKEQQQQTPDNKLPFVLDPGTRGGAIFLSLVLFVTPLIAYNVAVSYFHIDPVEAGRWGGAGFSGLCLLAWVATLLVRVVNKDMTYVSTTVQ
jgi:hypothetical protein